jgi:hypothetical protein
VDEPVGGRRTGPGRRDVAGLPTSAATDHGEEGGERGRGVPGAARGASGVGVGTGGGAARGRGQGARFVGKGEGSAVAEADVVRLDMVTSEWGRQHDTGRGRKRSVEVDGPSLSGLDRTVSRLDARVCDSADSDEIYCAIETRSKIFQRGVGCRCRR